MWWFIFITLTPIIHNLSWFKSCSRFYLSSTLPAIKADLVPSICRCQEPLAWPISHWTAGEQRCLPPPAQTLDNYFTGRTRIWCITGHKWTAARLGKRIVQVPGPEGEVLQEFSPEVLDEEPHGAALLLIYFSGRAFLSFITHPQRPMRRCFYCCKYCRTISSRMLHQWGWRTKSELCGTWMGTCRRWSTHATFALIFLGETGCRLAQGTLIGLVFLFLLLCSWEQASAEAAGCSL